MKNSKFVLLFFGCFLSLSIVLSSGCKKEENNDPAPPVSNTVKDIDGNVYHTVTIGTQVWMVENLRTTKYRDGTPIPNISDAAQWNSLTTGAYCMYNNDFGLASSYGLLYNWFAVNASGYLCPTGWHVPTEEEWKTLATYLGGNGLAGGKLKETGTTHWQAPNTDATNQTGFTALPGGSRNQNGSFSGIQSVGSWWSLTERYPGYAWSRTLYYQYSNLEDYDYHENNGFSVRCVKDQVVK